jgi:hypothetical protein
MCSQEPGAEGCEHIPEAAAGVFAEGADELDQKLPHPTSGPPLDLADFPFTFEHVHDASRSIRIEADSLPSKSSSNEWCVDVNDHIVKKKKKVSS